MIIVMDPISQMWLVMVKGKNVHTYQVKASFMTKKEAKEYLSTIT